MPQEIEVWYVLPAIRKELAIAMSKKGLNQRQIAKKLGITEPAVSQYIQNKRASNIKFNKVIKKEIEKSAEKIIKNSQPIREIQRVCSVIKDRMLICGFHHTYDPALPKNCKMCLKTK